MSFDGKVLRAMLRLARRHEAAGSEALALRVGGSAREVRASLRRLRSAGLVDVHWTGEGRLTLAGLAAAVAMLPGAPTARRAAARPSRAA